MKKLYFLLVYLALSAMYCVAYAAVFPQRSKPETPAKDSVLKVAVLKEKVVVKDSLPRVIGISLVRAVTNANPDTADVEASDKIYKQAFPGNIIRFTISNPAVFLRSRPTDQSKVVIFVNGVEMKGLCTGWYSSSTNMQIEQGKYVNFRNNKDSINIVLKRDETTRDAWNFFYNNTAKFSNNYVDIDASIGWEGMSALDRDARHAHGIRIVYYRPYVFVIWVVMFSILLIGFAILAFYTNAIKEGDKHGAYSLSLSQLLYWTTLAIGAFIYTLVLTDLTTSFNPTILYMLGISLSTTGVATVIDSQFRIKTDNLVKKPHSNFFKDVLTSDGISFSVQRIQIFAWNLILGIYFIIYTIGNKSMPEFSETLLFLAGFSSLSYLGAKSPENEAIKTAALKDTGAAEQAPAAVGAEAEPVAVG